MDPYTLVSPFPNSDESQMPDFYVDSIAPYFSKFSSGSVAGCDQDFRFRNSVFEVQTHHQESLSCVIPQFNDGTALDRNASERSVFMGYVVRTLHLRIRR